MLVSTTWNVAGHRVVETRGEVFGWAIDRMVAKAAAIIEPGPPDEPHRSRCVVGRARSHLAGGPSRADLDGSSDLPGGERATRRIQNRGVALHAIRHVHHDPGSQRDRTDIPPVSPRPRSRPRRGRRVHAGPHGQTGGGTRPPRRSARGRGEREVFGAHSHGFPSGHAAVAAALTVVVAARLSVRWAIGALVLGAFVVVGRMYVGAHLPLDLIGGAALGVVAGSSVNMIVRPEPITADTPI
jgi:hypothetical protein